MTDEHWEPDPDFLGDGAGDPEEESLRPRSIEWILDHFQPEGGREPGNQLVTAEPAQDRMKTILEKDADQKVTLKKHLAYGAFIAVGAQLALANLAFGMFGFANDWHIDAKVMIAWLAATVIETLGVVLIIAQHLFPPPEREQ